MTGVISNDALNNQQQKIIETLRRLNTPRLGQDFEDLAASFRASNRGGNFDETMRGLKDTRAKKQIEAELAIYAQMQDMAARGDREVKSVDTAIKEFTRDPREYMSILMDINNDSEPVNSRNANVKVMQHASKRGFVPLDVQKARLILDKTRSDMAATARGDNDPASLREWRAYNAMPQEQKNEYLRMKRSSGAEELDKTLGRQAGKRYDELDLKATEAETLLQNTEVARSALSQARLTGPVYGRIGRAASDPAYVNWQGAKNGLTLLAKSIYGMPNANFSDADRNFLDEITGGRFPTKEAAEKTIDRLELLARKAVVSARKKQQDLLSRKTYNVDVPVDIPTMPNQTVPQPTTKTNAVNWQEFFK